MILTAHQPVYLPWLGLFHKIALADVFVSFNRVQYLPKDWNNRNQIKTAAGPVWLSVPVLRKGYLEKSIDELEINNTLPWRRKHLRSIELSYRSAPYYKKYIPFFQELYGREWMNLNALNDHLLQSFLDMLGIHVRFLRASDFDFQGQKSYLVLDMCRELDADIYIFGELGKEYALQADFSQAGVQVLFQEYNHPVYPQQHGSFVSHLSIVDLLFNCGESSLDVLMSNNITRADLLNLRKL